MNKTTLKFFLYFISVSAVIATILLMINLLCVVCIGSDTYISPPAVLLKRVSENITQTGNSFDLPEDILPEDHWCIIIDQNGEVIWGVHQPDDIPLHYSLNDIAQMTRWFLNDYPVYVRTEDYGLLVLGLPKNAVGKYEMNYSMAWFDSLPLRLLGLLTLNLLFAALLALMIGFSFFKNVNILTNAIGDLQSEKPTHLSEKGAFRTLAQGINHTASVIQRKNAALAARDQARNNWISGISHDIRTPLTLVMGSAEALQRQPVLPDEAYRQTETILSQTVKIKKLVEDLNLISSLTYDMQPSRKKSVRLCPFIRRIVSQILNSGLAEHCDISLDLRDEKTAVAADEFMLERALFNLIHNSITHNPPGCRIRICAFESEKTAHITVSDNGCGIPAEVLQKIAEMPQSAHGIGLPMAYRIILVHGGSMSVSCTEGTTVRIELPAL